MNICNLDTGLLTVLCVCSLTVHGPRSGEATATVGAFAAYAEVGRELLIIIIIVFWSLDWLTSWPSLCA
jgi:hypothetical protein